MSRKQKKSFPNRKRWRRIPIRMILIKSMSRTTTATRMRMKTRKWKWEIRIRRKSRTTLSITVVCNKHNGGSQDSPMILVKQ